MTLDIFLLVALLKTNDCLCKTSLYCVSGVLQLFNWCTATVQLLYLKCTVYKLCTKTLKLCTAAKQVLYCKNTSCVLLYICTIFVLQVYKVHFVFTVLQVYNYIVQCTCCNCTMYMLCTATVYCTDFVLQLNIVSCNCTSCVLQLYTVLFQLS